MNLILAEILCCNAGSWFRSRISMTARAYNAIALKVSADINPAFAAHLRGCDACDNRHRRSMLKMIRKSAPHGPKCTCASAHTYFWPNVVCDNPTIVATLQTLNHTICTRTSWIPDISAVINDYHLMVRLKYDKLMSYRNRAHVTCPHVHDLRYRWNARDLGLVLPNAAYYGNIAKIRRLIDRKQINFLRSAINNAYAQQHINILKLLLTRCAPIRGYYVLALAGHKVLDNLVIRHDFAIITIDKIDKICRYDNVTLSEC